MFAEAINDILQDNCTPAVVRAIEAGGSPAKLWNVIEESGFLELLTSEEDGGASVGLSELYPVLRCVGQYATPVPIAQTIAARALLDRASIPDGMITLASHVKRLDNDALQCAYVPYGMVADYVIAQDGDSLLLLDTKTAFREQDGVHASLVATFTWKNASNAQVFERKNQSIQATGAALYAAMLSGVMTRAFDMTLQYCNDRVQFGKSLGKFQAVQHQLSVMAEQVAAAGIAAEASFQGGARLPEPLLAAIGKSRTSEAALSIAATSHALHGAIGVTQEYDLQLFTRRLHEWRMSYGSESFWNLFIGRHVLGETGSLTHFVQSFDGKS